MNPLEEHANLFANRNFQVQDSAEGDTVATIFGINQTRAGTNYLMLRKPDGYEYESAIDYCTLIARPISDMSDEEKQGFFESNDWYDTRFKTYSEYLRFMKELHQLDEFLDCKKYNELEEIEAYAENRDSTLYLLSIGVYPFDQSHFKSGTVISKAELKTEEL